MRKAFTRAATARATTPQPFAGLGFDVSGVREAARAMTPRRPDADMDRQASAMPPPVARPSGYSLLVTLCREIRGR